MCVCDSLKRQAFIDAQEVQAPECQASRLLHVQANLSLMTISHRAISACDSSLRQHVRFNITITGNSSTTHSSMEATRSQAEVRERYSGSLVPTIIYFIVNLPQQSSEPDRSQQS